MALAIVIAIGLVVALGLLHATAVRCGWSFPRYDLALIGAVTLFRIACFFTLVVRAWSNRATRSDVLLLLPAWPELATVDWVGLHVTPNLSWAAAATAAILVGALVVEGLLAAALVQWIGRLGLSGR